MKAGMTMDKSNSYIEMLINALHEKKTALKNVLQITYNQAEIVNQDDFKLEKFEETLNEKEVYIKKIQLLDDGFTGIYERVREQLLDNAKNYKQPIEQLKNLISEIAELGIEIQVQEQKNKQVLEKCLKKQKKEIKSFKKSRISVSNYYKNMNKTYSNQSYFMDKKN